MTIIGISISGCTCNECEAVRNGDELLRPQVNHVAGAAVAKVTCEGNCRTCPCRDCESVRVSPARLPPLDDDGLWLPQPQATVVGKVSPADREQLITAMGESLVDVVGIVRRSGGYLKPDDQALLRNAEAVIAKARTVP